LNTATPLCIVIWRNNDMRGELYLILDNIRSAYNVGAIFRTADGAGVKKMYLCGYTQCPHDGKKSYKTKAEKMVEKTALGAEQNVAWEKCNDLKSLIKFFKKKKIAVVGLEKTNSAVKLSDFKPQFPLALILGNEVEGISKDILEKCDKAVSIPMRGKKESLNVSVAAGIAIYGILS